MEQGINEALRRQQVTANLEMYKEIDAVELTEDEILSAIRAVKSKKLSDLKAKAYWERVNKPFVFPKVNADEFGALVLNNIKRTIPGFVVDEQNREMFNLLCLYCTRDPEFENLGFSLEKGIALIGPVGCGKTTLLHAFSVNPTNSYTMVSCRRVADDYSLTTQDKKDGVGGSSVIKMYSSLREVYPRDYWDQKLVGTGFDDLGTEMLSKHFGNQKEVMEDIILNRYDVPELKGKTHLTTNLSIDEIEERYGSRVRSRIRGMFNWMTFDITAADRRV